MFSIFRHTTKNDAVRKEDRPVLAAKIVKVAMTNKPEVLKSAFRKCGLVPVSLSEPLKQLPVGQLTAAFVAWDGEFLHQASEMPLSAPAPVIVQPPVGPLPSDDASNALEVNTADLLPCLEIRLSKDISLIIPPETSNKDAQTMIGIFIRTTHGQLGAELHQLVAQVVGWLTHESVLKPREDAMNI